MTKYQLAKLILMAGGLKSRKRVQKTVHLLKAAGCPLDVSFRLHYFGPYSADVAELLDRMTQNGILTETPQHVVVGTQYNYKFNEDVRENLEAYEQTQHGQDAKSKVEKHEELLNTLCETPLRILELASTLVAFHQAGSSWKEASEETEEFKGESPGSPEMTKAQELAREVAGSDEG